MEEIMCRNVSIPHSVFPQFRFIWKVQQKQQQQLQQQLQQQI